MCTDTHKAHERVLDPMELKSEANLSCPTQVLRTKQTSPRKESNMDPSLQSNIWFLTFSSIYTDFYQ